MKPQYGLLRVNTRINKVTHDVGPGQYANPDIKSTNLGITFKGKNTAADTTDNLV